MVFLKIWRVEILELRVERFHPACVGADHRVGPAPINVPNSYATMPFGLKDAKGVSAHEISVWSISS